MFKVTPKSWWSKITSSSRSVRKTELICAQSYNKEDRIQMPFKQLLEHYKNKEADFKLVLIQNNCSGKGRQFNFVLGNSLAT